ncbi:MAG TPA: hypothetical protein VLY66_00145 [Candidatus Eisenbacteria bacterium]|nr:hypothetical protein [Candidatus Eisenbacteria bacterium]
MALVVILCVTPGITSMTASAQSARTYHCTASNPCADICGDHVCSPGELAQMLAKSPRAPIGNATTATNGTFTATSQSVGEVIAGKISYVEQSNDGTQVLVRIGHPMAGQPLAVAIGFKDINNSFVQNQHYGIAIAQDNKTVLSQPNGYAPGGTDDLNTNPLFSNNPLFIEVTLNGVGLPTADPSTWTGDRGVVLNFTNVEYVQTPASMSNTMLQDAEAPEFGPIVGMIVAISIIGVVIISRRFNSQMF